MSRFVPLPQQVLMRDHLHAHRHATLWAEMGLGKTCAVLWTLDDLFFTGESRGALIICPKRVSLTVWPDEVEAWQQFKWMRVAHLRTPEGQQAWRDGSADIYLCTYDGISLAPPKKKPKGPSHRQPKLVDLLQHNCPVDTIVWDELSKMKDWGSRRAKAFWPFMGKFKRRWGLTGTPAPNNYLDLFAQYRLIDGGKALGLGITKYKENYFRGDPSGGKNPWTGEHYRLMLRDGAKEKIESLIGPVTLSLSRADYMDIPPTYYENVECDLPEGVRELYDTMEKEFIVELKRGAIVAVNAAVQVSKLQQITSGVAYEKLLTAGEKVRKITHRLHDAKVKVLKVLLKSGENLMVVTNYVHEREMLLQALPGVAEEFDEARWNAGQIKAMVVDPRSVGHGLNLQRGPGRTVVWFSLTYSRELYDQTNARVARTGQTRETFVKHLICPDTIDEAVLIALRTKGDQQSGLMSAVRSLQKLST